MGRRAGARLVSTVVASIAAGGVVGAGVSFNLYGPVVAVGLAVLIGLVTGLRVRQAILAIKRAGPAGDDHGARSADQ